ncbi:MAG: hypothetical protein AB9846_09755 [Tenuifilaceae bacterium]
MLSNKTYVKFPIWIVLVSNLLAILLYGLGFLVMFRLGWLFALIYLVYILILEFRILKTHCVDCYYYGKTCGFGKGLISSWLFKKGDSSNFCAMEITWKQMIPDILVTAIPVVVGLTLLIIDFDFVLLIEIILLLLLTTMGNAFVRGNLTCKYCKQREIGCPAEKLFSKQ